MRLSRARFSGSDASCRMPWPAAYITNMYESEFPAHTLLLDRRRAFVNHPLFGNLVESGALMPLP